MAQDNALGSDGTSPQEIQFPGTLRGLADLDIAMVAEDLSVTELGLAVKALEQVRQQQREKGAKGKAPRPLLALFCHGGHTPWSQGAGEKVMRDARLWLPKACRAAKSGSGPIPPSWRRVSDDADGWFAVYHPDNLSPKPLHQAIGDLINLLLRDGRPLRQYCCTLFFPLAPTDEIKKGLVPDQALRHRYRTCPPEEQETQGGKGEKAPERTYPFREQMDAQAYRYFSPVIRDQLYELEGAESHGPDPVQEWRLPPERLAGWRLDVGNEKILEAGGDPRFFQRARIKSLTLYRYFNGVYVLACSVTPEVLSDLRANAEAWPLFDDNAVWWHCLVFSTPEVFNRIRCLQLDAWMRFTSHARLLYPTFPEQQAEGKIARVSLKRPGVDPVQAEERYKPYIPRSLGQDISPVWVELASMFVPESERADLHKAFENYREMYDDRLFVNLVYGLGGPPMEAAELDRIFSLALFVDTSASSWGEFRGYAYSPQEVKLRLEKQGIHLWDEIGQRSGYTDFSNVYMGSGGFFCGKIAGDVCFIYGRMLLQALFYRASLRWYEQRITEVTEELIKEQSGGEEAKELRRDFIEFTNQCWFHDLTAQMQGREIFRLQQDALELEREYAFIKDEMERTDEFLQARYETRMLKKTDRLTMAGAVLAFVGLWLTALPLIKDREMAALDWPFSGLLRSVLPASWYFALAEWVQEHVVELFVGLPGLLILGLGFWLWRHGKK